jgi:hypothetical protein
VYLFFHKRFPYRREPQYIPRLHNVKVDHCDLKGKKNAVTDIVTPFDRLERNTVDELVEEERCGDAEIKPCEAFGAETVRQDLGGVAGHDTGLHIIEDAVEELDGESAYIAYELWASKVLTMLTMKPLPRPF